MGPSEILTLARRALTAMERTADATERIAAALENAEPEQRRRDGTFDNNATEVVIRG